MDDITPKDNMYINIIITQAICVILIFLSVLTVKYLFKGEYKIFKEWYLEEITADTHIEEVIG